MHIMFDHLKNRSSRKATNRILFICTGNFYRSRFAEATFNHYAGKASLPWRAFSRGLETDWAEGNISSHITHILKRRGIALHHTAETTIQLSEKDLRSARRIIALKESEHRPMMRIKFPEWTDRVEYWDTDDLDLIPPSQALPQLEERIRSLVEELTPVPH